MDARSLSTWFEDLKVSLESAYLKAATPWGQSGFSGPMERWTRLRKPIADLVDRSGSFLDVGCANGFLLECLLRWTGERGLALVPYGLDLSERLVALARKRLPAFADHFFVGNAWDWEPPSRFDFVRTELCYVPEECQRPFLDRLLGEFLTAKGSLLVAEYRSSREANSDKPWVDKHLSCMGYPVVRSASGFEANGCEVTRVALLRWPHRMGESNDEH